MNKRLGAITRAVTKSLSSPWSVLASIVMMGVWTVWAWHRHFDAFSQLVLSSYTGLTGYILFFMILYAQTWDSQATGLKLDEMIRADDKADNEFRHIEAADEAVVEEVKAKTCD